MNRLMRTMAAVVALSTGLVARAQLPVTDSLALWLDASQLAGLNDGDQVETWTDGSGQLNHAARQGSSSAGYPQYKTAQLNGLPVVRFNSQNGNTGDYFKFNRITAIRTVFWVVREDSGLSDGHFLLGDESSYHFHRASPNGPLWDGGNADANVRNGTTRLMGTAVNGTTTALPANQYQLISLVTAGPVQANQVTQDRVYHGSWVGDIAELLIYTRALTSEEEAMVGGYLAGKYGLATAYPPFNSTVPYGLTAMPGDGQVALAWTAFTGATNYNVKRSLVSGGPHDLLATSTTNSYLDTAVTNGTPYFYVVSAITNSMETGDSAEVTATPAPVDAAASTVVSFPPAAWADGASPVKITVTLKSAGGTPVPGKDISLAATGPATPVITTVSATSDTNGQVLFTATSTTAGAAVFTATDVTDGNLVLTQTVTVTFVTRPPDLSVYIPDSLVLQTWDFTNSLNPGPWQLGRTTALTDAGIKLGAALPELPDHGAMVGMMRIATPAGLTYFNGGVEMTYYAPAGPPPTSGFEFLALWRNNPRNGFAVLSDSLTGTAYTRQQEVSDSAWTIPNNAGGGLAGLHTMALLRYPDGKVETYVDGALVNTRSSTDPAAALEWISIGFNVNGNMYMPFDSLISQVRAFTYSPPLGPVDPDTSTVVAAPASVWADGLAFSTITVTLKDAAGHFIQDKAVSLTKTSGPEGPVITPAAAVTGPNGKAVFTVASTNAGANEFTATDTTDDPDVVLSQKPVVNFMVPGLLAINVNFDTSLRSGLVGPAGGPGETWNQQLNAQGLTASGLVDTNGVGTPIGFINGAYNVGAWDGPALALLIGGAFTGGDPADLVITNVPSGRKYDLYLVSYFYNEQGSKATFTTPNATTNGAVQTCDNGGGSAENATWVRGVNFALFQSVQPDANNKISVTMTRTDPSIYAHLSGFQLVEAIPPKPTRLAGTALFVR